MKTNRRSFIKLASLGMAVSATGGIPVVESKVQEKTLVILHTNDTHSHLEPFPMNHRTFPGMGGIAARKKLIDEIRKEGHPTLLFDCGDIFQGTPYFNFFLGEPEIKAMNMMGYQAATIGNHEFDGGLDNMYKQFKKANFPLIISNYDTSQTILHEITQKHKVFVNNGIRIGVLGLGVELEGLVLQELCEGVIYQDPLQAANEVADFLKEKEKCDLVIALSHLGYQYNSNKICDIDIAEKTNNIDIILGGHTHTFMDKPDIRYNLSGQEVIIHQVGWAGVNLGRLNVKFSGKKRKISSERHTVIVDK